MKYYVVATSENTNSFGLHSVLLLSPSGEGHQLLMSAINKPDKGAMIKHEKGRFHCAPYEVPRALSPVPPSQARAVLREAGVTIQES